MHRSDRPMRAGCHWHALSSEGAPRRGASSTTSVDVRSRSAWDRMPFTPVSRPGQGSHLVGLPVQSMAHARADPRAHWSDVYR